MSISFVQNCTSETEFVQVSHIFSFRCRPSDPPNCDTHSESKVDSPSNMYFSSQWQLVKGSWTKKMWKFPKSRDMFLFLIYVWPPFSHFSHLPSWDVTFELSSVRPILETSPSSALTVEEGEPALLSCVLTSGSADHIYWRRANTKVSQVTKLKNSKLTITTFTF